MYKNNLKKIDLVKKLKIKSGFSSNFSTKLINDLIDVLIKIIRTGNLNLKNIGSFKVINKRKNRKKSKNKRGIYNLIKKGN